MQPDAETVRSTILLLLPIVLGLLQQIVTEPPARSWHLKLNKCPSRPPAAVHPLVWTWSYLSLGYASHLVDLQVEGVPLVLLSTIYVIHLMLLNGWGVLFFTMRRIDYALNCMLLIDITASVLLMAVSTMVPFAAALCLPYFLWLLELTYLNVYMFRNNVDTHLVGMSKEDVLKAYKKTVNENGARSSHGVIKSE